MTIMINILSFLCSLARSLTSGLLVCSVRNVIAMGDLSSDTFRGGLGSVYHEKVRN